MINPIIMRLEVRVLQLCLNIIICRIAHAFQYFVCLDCFCIVGAVDKIEITEINLMELRLIVYVIGDSAEPILACRSMP